MDAEEEPMRRSGKAAVGAAWQRWLRGRPPTTVYIDFSEPARLPKVEAGQQVIDRRNGDTYHALGWQSDMTLKAVHANSAMERLIPWRAVVPAGRARKARR